MSISLGLPYIPGCLRRGKKIDLATQYEPWVLESFSDYLVIDEIYDGPYAIFYAVDPIAQKRIAFHIAYEATEEEARKFFTYLKNLGISVKGITTDGSPLYPSLIQEFFPEATHQICIFHILKDLNRLVLRALARFRKSLPKGRKLKRGRPVKNNSPRQDPVRKFRKALWEHRYLWVKKHLSEAEELTIKNLCRRQSFLRDLRHLVDLIYQLFDKRCRTQTALEKLQRLRSYSVFRQSKYLKPILKRLNSPHLEKALCFLDNKLLEATSNSVESSNRKHRKFQKSVYRVRALHTLSARIKFEMLLDKERATRAAFMPLVIPFYPKYRDTG
jgi:hypothetical protein